MSEFINPSAVDPITLTTAVDPRKTNLIATRASLCLAEEILNSENMGVDPKTGLAISRAASLAVTTAFANGREAHALALEKGRLPLNSTYPSMTSAIRTLLQPRQDGADRFGLELGHVLVVGDTNKTMHYAGGMLDARFAEAAEVISEEFPGTVDFITDDLPPTRVLSSVLRKYPFVNIAATKTPTVDIRTTDDTRDKLDVFRRNLYAVTSPEASSIRMPLPLQSVHEIMLRLLKDQRERLETENAVLKDEDTGVLVTPLSVTLVGLQRAIHNPIEAAQ